MRYGDSGQFKNQLKGRFEFDKRELKKLARDFDKVRRVVRPVANNILRAEMQRAVIEARAAAPKARPWLSTSEGLQLTQKWDLSWSMVSNFDPRGRSVGYRVVYGTSNTPPNDFVSAPIIAAGDRANRQLLAAISSALKGM